MIYIKFWHEIFVVSQDKAAKKINATLNSLFLHSPTDTAEYETSTHAGKHDPASLIVVARSMFKLQ
jgi:uncharacterized protein YqkB